MRALAVAIVLLLTAATSLTLAAAPFTRYTVSSESNVVRDNMTGLFWLREAEGPVSWNEADAFCRALGIDDRNWRLPRIKELLTLIDPAAYGTLIDSIIFPNTLAERFWTSTPHQVATENYWAVDFAHGGTQHDEPSAMLWVRCVQH